MPIVPNDIKYYLSGGAANSSAAASLGGIISSTEITDASANNLWDDVSSGEGTAGDVEYRGFYVKNTHATISLTGTVVWIETLTSSSSTEFDIALAAEAVNVTMATIANESTAPATVSFTRPTDSGSGLSIGTIPAGQAKGIWIRRTVTASAVAASDTGTIRVEGSTTA